MGNYVRYMHINTSLQINFCSHSTHKKLHEDQGVFIQQKISLFFTTLIYGLPLEKFWPPSRDHKWNPWIMEHTSLAQSGPVAYPVDQLSKGENAVTPLTFIFLPPFSILSSPPSFPFPLSLYSLSLNLITFLPSLLPPPPFSAIAPILHPSPSSLSSYPAP